MLLIVLRKLLSLAVTLFVLASFTFLLLRIVPGGPFDTERALPPDVKANIIVKFGLDLPVWAQFQHYISGLVRGDLGPSYRYLGRDVRDVIAEALPISLQLGAFALLWAIPFGLLLGLLSAYKQKSIFSVSSTIVTVASLSMPSYLVAAALIYIFCVRLDILPPAFWQDWHSMVLPVITLGLRPAASIARLIRSSLREALRADYIRTGRAKGLSESVILWKHCLRNSIIPAVSLLGPITANIIMGTFVIEYIFAIPGMGKYFIDSVSNRDYPLIMGVTMVYGLILVLCNLLVDLLYTWIDPRIRVM